MTLPRWFLDDSETKTIAVMQDKESLIEPNSARDSRSQMPAITKKILSLAP